MSWTASRKRDLPALIRLAPNSGAPEGWSRPGGLMRCPILTSGSVRSRYQSPPVPR